jgi:hypothetical protein
MPVYLSELLLLPNIWMESCDKGKILTGKDSGEYW